MDLIVLDFSWQPEPSCNEAVRAIAVKMPNLLNGNLGEWKASPSFLFS